LRTGTVVCPVGLPAAEGDVPGVVPAPAPVDGLATAVPVVGAVVLGVVVPEFAAVAGFVAAVPNPVAVDGFVVEVPVTGRVVDDLAVAEEDVVVPEELPPVEPVGLVVAPAPVAAGATGTGLGGKRLTRGDSCRDVDVLGAVVAGFVPALAF
jgi:hypothetical protein